MTKTPEELHDLKIGWMHDPCWDLESTEDFQDHREELLAFRLAQEAKWEVQREAHRASEAQRIRDRAASLGIPGAVDLVKYLESLELRIARLDDKIEEQSHYINWRKENWHE